MELQTAVIQYITFRSTSGRKAATVLKDEQCLSNLVFFYGKNTEVHILKDLDDFFSAAAFESSSYFNSHVSIFRGFFKWCRSRGIMAMDCDPMFGREHAPASPTEKKYIPVEQFNDLLSAAENPRDRMIVALGLFLFLRQGEISTLRVEDVTDDRVGVRVWKTNQFDRMQINSELAEELARWRRTYRASSGFLCPSTRLVWGHRYFDPSRRLLRPYKAVQRALASLGWEDEEIDGEGGHLLRRSGARALYFALRESGSERAMALVQRRLHHKNREMTERYIGVTADDAELDSLLLGRPMFPIKLAPVIRLRSVEG